MENKTITHEKNLELFDLLQVLWKWKYFIIVTTLVCVGVVGVITYFSNKAYYSSSMLIDRGLLKIEDLNKYIYLDSEENLENLIKTGTFNDEIRKYVNKKFSDLPQAEFKFDVFPVKPNNILIVCNATQKNIGTVINKQLFLLLQNNYESIINYYKDTLEVRLNTLKMDIKSLKSSYNEEEVKKINSLKHDNQVLISKLQLIEKSLANNSEKSKDQSKLNNPYILYTILSKVQNISQLNNTNYLALEINKEMKIVLKQKISKKIEEIETIKLNKKIIQNIKMIKQPTQSNIPTKTSITKYLALTFILGIFITIILSFFFDYIKTAMQREKK